LHSCDDLWNPAGGPLARSRVTQVLLLVSGGLLLLYIGALAILWKYQEQIVFQPPRDRAANAEAGARRVRYRSSDGIELFAYIVGECTPGTTLVLGFHGNADLSRWLIPWAATAVRETQACVMLPEFRGYDGIAGVSTYAGSALDARAALEYVRDSLGVPASNTVYYGHSLGAAIAAELTSVEPPRALVLHSPFSSARAMGARMVVPGVTTLWRFISRVHFDTIERVRRLSSPVWVAHGDRDVIIPARMGREVFAAAATKGELLIVNGAGHNDVPEVAGAPYWEWLRRAVSVRVPANSNLAAPAER
jgi:uncharacterized protein